MPSQRFTFKLQTVLKHRERQSRAIEQELAKAQRQKQAYEEQIDALRQQKQESLAAFTNANLLADLGFSWDSSAYIEHFRQQEAALLKELAKAEQQRLAIQQRYLIARKDQQALENLEAKQRQIWQEALLADEEAQNEELTQQRVAQRLLNPC